ncbi:unnamed protein product [Peniophora sp. CBMAI 1063]|nr:unnamed protein product [Peniophora sp. CBMAI 1063]
MAASEGLVGIVSLIKRTTPPMRAACNGVQPPRSLNSLPLEILNHIFILFAETERPIPPFDIRARHIYEERKVPGEYTINLDDDDGEPVYDNMDEPPWMRGRGGHLGWILLGHVCRLWRKMLLALTELWAGDIGSLPGSLQAMLERAGDARPLILRLYGATFRRTDPEEGFWKAVACNDGAMSQRIREVYWIESRIYYLEDTYFFRTSRCSFIALHTFVLSTGELSFDPAKTIDAPNLRVARLTNVLCHFTSNVLAELSICGTAMRDNPEGLRRWGLYHRTLFKLLKVHKHSLLHLRLDVRRVHGYLHPHEPILEFTRLQTLEYRADEHEYNASGLISPLDRMSYPNFTSVHFHVDSRSTSVTSKTLGPLLKPLLRLDPVSPSGLGIEESSTHGGEDHLILRFYAMADDHEPHTDTPISTESFIFGGDTLRLTLHLAHKHMALRVLLHALSELVPTANVKALSYSGFCYLCKHDAVGVLQRFPAIRAFHLVDPYDSGTLMDTLHQPGPDGPLAPLLERLAFSQRSPDHVLSSSALAHELRARYGPPEMLARHSIHAPLKDLMIDSTVVLEDEERSGEARERIASFVTGSLYWKGRHITS